MKRVAVLLVVMTCAGAAHAEDGEDEVGRMFAEGSRHFALGEFAEAAFKFKQAYRLRDDAVFLYNVAQAYRLMGDLPQALFFYRSYLRAAPRDVANRAEVERRIEQLEPQVLELRRTSSEPPTGQIAPQPPAPDVRARIPSPVRVPVAAAAPPPAAAPARRRRSFYRRPWFWAGAVALAAGVTIVVLARPSRAAAPRGALGTLSTFE